MRYFVIAILEALLAYAGLLSTVLIIIVAFVMWRKSSRTRTFLAVNVWLVISALIASLAVWLAQATFYLARGYAGRLAIGVEVVGRAESLKQPPILTIQPRDNGTIDFFVDWGSHDVRLVIKTDHLNENQSCQQWHQPMGQVGHFLRLQFANSSGEYKVSSVQDPPPRERLEIVCYTNYKIFRTSYTGREIVIERTSTTDPYIVDFSFFEESRPDIVGGAPVRAEWPSARRIDSSIPGVTVSWDEKTAIQSTSLRLVIVGLLVAMAAAAVIEWARPRIEEFRASGRVR